LLELPRGINAEKWTHYGGATTPPGKDAAKPLNADTRTTETADFQRRGMISTIGQPRL
jgi:hypothetical protein